MICWRDGIGDCSLGVSVIDIEYLALSTSKTKPTLCRAQWNIRWGRADGWPECRDAHRVNKAFAAQVHPACERRSLICSLHWKKKCSMKGAPLAYSCTTLLWCSFEGYSQVQKFTDIKCWLLWIFSVILCWNVCKLCVLLWIRLDCMFIYCKFSFFSLSLYQGHKVKYL